MVNTARQEGYEQGLRSSQNGVDAEANTLLMDINQKLAALLSETADIRTEVENQALEMVKVAVLKLVPTLMADEAAELVSKFILLYRGAQAIVMLGNARDANDLIKQNYSVWCEGFNPVGCFNRDVPLTEEIKAEVHRKQALYDGAVAVCDDTGVVIIPKNQLTDDFLGKLHHIEAQEDIWFDCVDHRKWDTYDTVCLKKYLMDADKEDG